MNVSTIRPAQPEPEEEDTGVTPFQALRVLAWVLIGIPTGVAVNVVLWNVALWIGRQ